MNLNMAASTSATNHSSSSSPSLRVILSGGASGMFAQAATWPLEFAKTLKQFPPPKSNPHPNVWHQFSHYRRTHGLWSVYRGLLPPITLAFPRASLRFQMYHVAETTKGAKLSPQEKFVAGVAAGCAESWLLMTPAEVIKVYCIDHKTTLATTLKEIYTSTGLKGFWSGAVAMGAKQAVMQSVTYVTVDLWTKVSPAIQERILSGEDNNSHSSDSPSVSPPPSSHTNSTSSSSASSSFVGGILGGGLAVLLNNPFDVVRTRQQRKATCGGIGSVVKGLYQESGLRGFYKGVGLRALRMGLLQGCTFGLFSAATTR